MVHQGLVASFQRVGGADKQHGLQTTDRLRWRCRGWRHGCIGGWHWRIGRRCSRRHRRVGCGGRRWRGRRCGCHWRAGRRRLRRCHSLIVQDGGTEQAWVLPGIVRRGPPRQFGIAVAAIVVVVDLHLQAESVAVDRTDADLCQRQPQFDDVTTRHSCDRGRGAGRHGCRVGAGEHDVAIVPAHRQLEVIDPIIAARAVAVVAVDEDFDAVVVVPTGPAVVDKRLIGHLHYQIQIGRVVECAVAGREIAGRHSSADDDIGFIVLGRACPDGIHHAVDDRRKVGAIDRRCACNWRGRCGRCRRDDRRVGR